MKKNDKILLAVVAVLLVLVFVLLYMKDKVHSSFIAVGDDNFDATKRLKVGQRLQLKQNTDLTKVGYYIDTKGVFATGQKEVSANTKLYYVSKYNQSIIVRKKGLFFDDYYMVYPSQLV